MLHNENFYAENLPQNPDFSQDIKLEQNLIKLDKLKKGVFEV